MKDTSFTKYKAAIKSLPREVFNRHLIWTAFIFALSGMPKGWDEGSVANITQLGSFKRKYRLSDEQLHGDTIENLVSFVSIGCGVGAFLSFFLNDKLGRKWSIILYQVIYLIGVLACCFSNGNLSALYFGRIFGGLGIGALTVVGPLSLAEIAPKTVRGFITLWFNMAMLSGQVIGVFAVYGCNVNISDKLSLQYQIPWFVQCSVPAIAITGSFFAVESPRWLMIMNRREEALSALLKLRGLPQDHLMVQDEYAQMLSHIEDENTQLGERGIIPIVKETFLVRSNLRRVQLTIIAYILAQFSGANSVTNYLPTIFGLIGVQSSNTRIYSSGLYGVAKLVCTLLASLFFIDMLGRRKSLMIGITIQMTCHSYLAGYLKYFVPSPDSVPKGATDAAIAVIYIHALGWAVGLFTLPYVFGAELWPNRIRSFGGALSQCFHWLFFFAITKATPKLLKSMDIWGAFLFFVGWCMIALLYTYFFIPETSGLSLDDMDEIFKRPMWMMRQPLPSQLPFDRDAEIKYEKADVQVHE